MSGKTSTVNKGARTAAYVLLIVLFITDFMSELVYVV